MARLLEIKRFVNTSENTITFEGYDKTGDAPKPTGHRIRFVMAKASQANRDYAALHGFNQRIGDAGALGFNKETNQFATMDEKFAAMRSIAEHIESGAEDWELPRSANGPRMDSTVELLTKALMVEKPERDEVTIRLKVKAMSVQVRKAMLKSERLAKIVSELESAQVKSIDTGALFEELDG